MVEVRLETSKLVLFVRKQTIRSAKIGSVSRKWRSKISSISFRESSIQWKKTRRRNQKKESASSEVRGRV